MLLVTNFKFLFVLLILNLFVSLHKDSDAWWEGRRVYKQPYKKTITY